MSEVRTNSITDAAGTGAPDFPNGVNAATALIVKVDETERMRIDASGNLGLGVTPSAWTRKALQIGDAAAAYVANGSGGATVIATNMFFDGANKYATTAAAARYSVGSGNHEWYIAPSGTAGNAITFTQAMTLDASGNLGIGTTSPTAGYRLDVFGQAQIGDGGGNADINFNASSTGRFLVAGTERLRIASAGQIGIGGANYGTSGQVLTSGGSGAAPSWASPFAVDQTWQAVTRVANTNYQNTTGRPIMVYAVISNTSAIQSFQVSTNATTWVNAGNSQSANAPNQVVVPNGHYYRITQTAGTTSVSATELR